MVTSGGVSRTKTQSYARWFDGKRMLYDVAADPLQMNNLIDAPEAESLADEMENTLTTLMDARNDALQPATRYTDWYDAQRRIVRNAHGPPRRSRGRTRLVPLKMI